MDRCKTPRSRCPESLLDAKRRIVFGQPGSAWPTSTASAATETALKRLQALWLSHFRPLELMSYDAASDKPAERHDMTSVSRSPEGDFDMRGEGTSEADTDTLSACQAAKVRWAQNIVQGVYESELMLTRCARVTCGFRDACNLRGAAACCTLGQGHLRPLLVMNTFTSRRLK
jgi:hypothetical protein